MTVQNKNDYLNYDHESRITRLEVTIENINQTLIEIKADMKNGFNKIDEKFDKINSRLWQLVFFIIACSTGILGVIAHGFKWI